jgi:Transcriptional regulator containing an amidase domain and an AraC-type DNA-binding HTH domain
MIAKMKIAYIVFNGVTWLDFIGVYDAVSRLKSMGYVKDLSWDICSYTETAADNFGLKIIPDLVRPPLNNYNAIIVPGGHGTRTLINDADFLNWISTAKDVEYKMSVCTGSLLLGAAGFLRTKKATTNFLEYETLRQYCAEVLTDRLVIDGNIITAGAVSSSLDLGLYLCEKWAGTIAREAIQERMDYHPQKKEQA